VGGAHGPRTHRPDRRALPRRGPTCASASATTRTNAKLGFKTAEDLRRDYPDFYWNQVSPYIGAGLRHLGVTREGRQRVANLHAQVVTTEHE
jgi:hypothetical protein